MNANNSTPQRQLQADLELVTLDFASEFAEHPETALARLEALVRHRDSCLARIASLRVLQNRTDQPLQASIAEPIPDDPGPLLPDTPETLPAAPIEPSPEAP